MLQKKITSSISCLQGDLLIAKIASKGRQRQDHLDIIVTAPTFNE